MIKITFASQDRIEQYPEQVRVLLSALGHPEAFVTDESMVRDFTRDNAVLAEVIEQLGFPIAYESLLADLAEIMARPVH